MHIAKAVGEFCERCAKQWAIDTNQSYKKCPKCFTEWTDSFNYCGEDGGKLEEVKMLCKNDKCELRTWCDYKISERGNE